MYNYFNEALPLVYAETPLKSSVQPISLEFDLAEGGVGFEGRLRAFVPDGQIVGDTGAALRAAFDVPGETDTLGDFARFNGLYYRVNDSKHWQGSHTEADLIRTDNPIVEGA